MTGRFRRVAAGFLAAGMAAGSITAPHAQAESSLRSGLEVNQGWRFQTLRGGCTIGYNDPVNRLSYTAAHCAEGVTRVFLVDDSNRRLQKPIHAGTIEMAPQYDPRSGSNDWAVIHWEDGVKINSNTFDGDGVVPVSTLRKGQRVCHHGFTSHGAVSSANCGELIGTLGNQIYVEMPESARHGDSGGPMYLPGGGLVGVVSTNLVLDRDGQTHHVVAASAPSDGPLVTKEAHSQLLNRHYGSNIEIQEHDLDPGSSLINGLTEAGSSDAEGVVIAMVVLGTLLAGMAVGSVLKSWMM